MKDEPKTNNTGGKIIFDCSLFLLDIYAYIGYNLINVMVIILSTLSPELKNR